MDIILDIADPKCDVKVLLEKFHRWIDSQTSVNMIEAYGGGLITHYTFSEVILHEALVKYPWKPTYLKRVIENKQPKLIHPFRFCKFNVREWIIEVMGTEILNVELAKDEEFLHNKANELVDVWRISGYIQATLDGGYKSWYTVCIK